MRDTSTTPRWPTGWPSGPAVPLFLRVNKGGAVAEGAGISPEAVNDLLRKRQREAGTGSHYSPATIYGAATSRICGEPESILRSGGGSRGTAA